MSDQLPEQTEPVQSALSSVKVATNARGYTQVTVSCYDGVLEDEMRRLGELALATYDDVTAQLGKRAAASNLA